MELSTPHPHTPRGTGFCWTPTESLLLSLHFCFTDGLQSSSTSRLRKGGTKHPFVRLSVPLVSGFCSVRHGLALILHLCNLSISTQQMNMSIALPVMVNNTALPSSPNASTERPPVDSQDNWNETLNESKAVVSLMKLWILSLTQMFWPKELCAKIYYVQRTVLYKSIIRIWDFILVSISVPKDYS